MSDLRARPSPGRTTVGLTRHRGTEIPLSSVHEVFAGIQAVAESSFDTRPLLPYHRALPPQAIDSLWLEFLSSCAVVVTDVPYWVGRFRQQHGLDFRMIFVALGSFPRGAGSFRRALPFYRSDDCLVFSSRADRAIFERLTSSCRAGRALVPFAVDPARFHPCPTATRLRLRSLLGWSEADCVFVYAGRITAEKNLHGLLGLFDALAAQHPTARLLLIGQAEDTAFTEFGTGPFDLDGILGQMVDGSPRLQRSVRRLPWVPRQELPALLSAGDVFLNLSLNHDENFGFSQVEAMSCGLPVVCTAWGGLKDTAVDGETALTVPTYVCRRGIQVDLWRAFQHCQALLLSPERRLALGRTGRQRVMAEFSPRRFARAWTDLLAGSPAAVEHGGPENRLSPFGRAFQAAFEGRQRPSFDGGNHALYAGLIEPYATAAEPPPLPRQGLAFLTTVSFDLRETAVEVLDPLWPGTFAVGPVEHRIIASLESALLERDVAFLALDELRAAVQVDEPALSAALCHLRAQGIVGCSETEPAQGRGSHAAV
jgi:glycosyltransferase involved in cell wall biosynthesis